MSGCVALAVCVCLRESGLFTTSCSAGLLISLTDWCCCSSRCLRGATTTVVRWAPAPRPISQRRGRCPTACRTSRWSASPAARRPPWQWWITERWAAWGGDRCHLSSRSRGFRLGRRGFRPACVRACVPAWPGLNERLRFWGWGDPHAPVHWWSHCTVLCSWVQCLEEVWDQLPRLILPSWDLLQSIIALTIISQITPMPHCLLIGSVCSLARHSKWVLNLHAHGTLLYVIQMSCIHWWCDESCLINGRWVSR